AAAVDRRLDAAAAALAGDPDDDRTKTQRRADLFSEWLLSAEHAPASINIDIAVTIPVTSLSGSSGQPAVSSDGAWAIPAAWALDSEVTSIPFWHRLLVDPVTDDVLVHDYIGRYPPDVLRRALQFRDMTCRAPGCTKPADRCDIDHRMPWPEGNTSGDNLWALCRRHHNLKGHRVLQWVLPDGQKVAA
ncbi:MAG TPA: HNH endonuclease signature motif containing protein, partial [Aeromicrobium sp.]